MNQLTLEKYVEGFMGILSKFNSVFKSTFLVKSEVKFRIPEKVSREEWDNKLEIYDRLTFTYKEQEFFKKFKRKNSKDYIVSYYLHDVSLSGIQLFNPKRCHIKIIKLDDEWYLISSGDASYEWYICDEWEEVLGYLKGYKFKI